MSSITQVMYLKAPMNLPVSDRVALLNIVLRDLQAGGARVFATRMVGDGWEIEYMGEPEVLVDGSYQ